MPYLTANGEVYLLKLLKGDWSGGTLGYNRIGLFGSTGGAADALIDTVKTITWGFSVGNADIYINSSPLPIFSVPANTVVKGVCLFNSVEGVTYGTELSKYTLSEYKTFVNSGTVEVASLRYNFERIL